ncbi:CGI-121-domain-containing protein [Wolfiporia cocos MD-104 SS10]|uniref:EKC/KEOPS complex subunit CGI121 n=1 Tax=Wolfiporia cocos (strain MD-104) TaxID=742152 RepID=A0A2H3JY68_WOLCO|nr:CGI-121-domain-containing protein [Wolfiporia cocos MD-104 SS10]
METFRYAHLPPDVSHVHVALFTNVANAAQIRARIIKAATAAGPEGELEREAVNFAFIDARLICSVLHLQTAIVQAVLAEVQGSLRTKTVHAEILWALSPNNNITEAIRRFGVSDTTAALFVVRIAPPDLGDVQARMLAVVSGDISPIGDLGQFTDWASVKKYYKLNGEPALKESGLDVAQEHLIVDEIVTSSVAMKSVMA